MDGRSYLGGRGAPLARCPSQKTIAHGDRAGAEEGGLLLRGSARHPRSSLRYVRRLRRLPPADAF